MAAAKTRVEKDLVSWFDEEVEALKEYLAAGHCVDYSDYKYVIGQIRGLRSAQAEWAASIGEEEEDEEV